MDTIKPETPEKIEVPCPECGAKIAEYIGPIGYDTPIVSRYFKRVDGTSPAHGSATDGTCPACHKGINELIAVMNAVSSKLAQQTAAEVLSTSEVLANPPEPVSAADMEAEDEPSSDCSS